MKGLGAAKQPISGEPRRTVDEGGRPAGAEVAARGAVGGEGAELAQSEAAGLPASKGFIA